MTISLRTKNILKVVFIAVFLFSIIFIVYMGSLPKRYVLSVGSVSDKDITAPRTVKDSFETEKRALLEKLSVSPIFVRSEELSQKSVADLNKFFTDCKELRKANFIDGRYIDSYRSLSNKLIELAKNNYGIDLTDDEAFQLITADDSLVDVIHSQATSIASLILVENLDDNLLAVKIEDMTANIANTEESYYISNRDIIKSILTKMVVPNAVFDSAATEAAQEAAYKNKKSNPIMIEKGTRVVSLGDVITEKTYSELKDLDLLETGGFDYTLLIGIIIYMSIVFTVLALYVYRFESYLLSKPKDLIAIAVSFILPIIASVYLTDVSTLISTVFFTSVIVATYLGIQSGIVLSIIQLLIICPIHKFDVEFIFVSIIGIFVSSVIAGQKSRKFNTATLIIFTALTCFVASAGFNLVIKSSKTEMFTAALWAIISASVSVVAAIGSMPIFELLSNTVSPVRLIDLSQPGNPLLKRLFLEAPGTSQHSMMVANLADSAADAIGADALLAKVGAYYHDIGKLDKPLYFTENQQNGINPHDGLSPEESMAIISSHPDQGVRLARKNRLPNSIVKIIQEHHGTTCQVFFYHKAKVLAQQNGLPEPTINEYRYRGGIPSSKESAVVMLADTCEAAIRSSGSANLEEAEDLFRKLVKQKIEQDQMNSSGLSFNDIETVIRAFLQVYAGFFHERVKYPDDSNVR